MHFTFRNMKKQNKNNTNIKTKDVEYFNSSDSSDSENELDTSNPKKFAINLLKKIQRHNLKPNSNSKSKPDEIAKKFNLQIMSMDKKYKQYSKNPSKYKNLRQFYKNLLECKNLYNLLMDDVDKFKNKFNFNKFIHKYNSSNSNNLLDSNDNTSNKRPPNLLDLLFGAGRNSSLNANSSNSNSNPNSTESKLDIEFKELYEKDIDIDITDINTFLLNYLLE